MQQIDEASLNNLLQFFNNKPHLQICGVNLQTLTQNYIELINAERNGQADIPTMVKGSINPHQDKKPVKPELNSVVKLVNSYKENKKQ